VSGKKKGTIFVIVSVFLCIAAAIGGYKGSRYIADRITVKAEENAERAGLFKPSASAIENGSNTVDDLDEKISPIKNNRPSSVIFVTDFETGKIEKLALEIIDTINMSAKYIYFDTDISYTITPALYRKLANGNVLLPQTVKLKELYGYYGADTAFEAGRKIVGELVGKEIDYYISLSKEYAPEDFMIERVTALGLKELHTPHENRLSDIPENEDSILGSYGEKLKDSDVKTVEAPVIKRNESCFLDVSGLWEILPESP